MNELFDACLYFKLNRMLRQMTLMADCAFSKHNVSSSHAYLMILIARKPKIGTVELSKELNLNPSTITRLVDKLVAQGYLLRMKEGKRCEISCSKEGEILAKALHRTWNKFQKEMREKLGEDTYASMNVELQKIENKINE